MGSKLYKKHKGKNIYTSNSKFRTYSYIRSMKKTFIFGIIIIITAFTGCKPKRDPSKTYFDTPSEYNDFIVNNQKEVMSSFEDFATAVNRSDKDSMSFFRKTLINRNQLAMDNVGKLADYKGDTIFRAAAMDLFKYIDFACDNELKQIVDIASKDSTITEEDVELIHNLSQTYTLQEKEKNDALIAAQAKFAKKFNVIIQ